MSGFYFTPAIKERFNLSTDISDAEGRAWLLKTLTHKSAESYLKYSTASIQPNQKLGHRMGCLALLTASKRRMEVAGVPVYAVFYRDQVDIVDVPTYEQCLVNWRIVENELATEEYKTHSLGKGQRLQIQNRCRKRVPAGKVSEDQRINQFSLVICTVIVKLKKFVPVLVILWFGYGLR
eukprot:gene3302-3521_t